MGDESDSRFKYRPLDRGGVPGERASSTTTTSDRLVGLDEAGRGSVVGPLVVAAVSLAANRAETLRGLGVRDSKTLTPESRSQLYKHIVDLCEEVRFLPIHPPEIDYYVKRGLVYKRLNYLEAIYMARLIDSMQEGGTVYVDAPDTNPPRWRKELARLLERGRRRRIIAEHRADTNYVPVSAASIVAKVERDKAIEELKSVHGDFGSGYPSDEKTIDFLKCWVEDRGSVPSFARKSWKTWERIVVRPLFLC